MYDRSQYFADALPDWVGELEEGVDYRELLRNAVVSVPVDDTMELSVADPDADDSDEANADEEDIAQGTIPQHGSTTGDVDPEPSTPIDTHAQSSTPINSQPPQEPSTATAKPSTQPSTAINNEPSTAINREPRMTKLPKATVVTKSVKMPVKIASEPEGVIQKPTPAKKRLRARHPCP